MIWCRKLRFGRRLTASSLHFNVAVQHLGIPFPPSLFRRSPKGLPWMWMASFSRSSSGRLALLITDVSFQLMGWWLPGRAPQLQTSAETGFGMHLGASSVWFPASAWSHQCRICHSGRGSGTPHWLASPSAEQPSPWSTLSGRNGWT